MMTPLLQLTTKIGILTMSWLAITHSCGNNSL
jgi:hypothetical protein